MTTIKRRALKIAGAVIAIALVLAFLGPPVARYVMVAIAAEEFRDSYNTEGYPAPHIDSLDWSVKFGGEIGRERLIAFTTDNSIKPEGRRDAQRIVDAIDRGMCRWYLKMCLDEETMYWEARPLFQWILRQQPETQASMEFAAEQERFNNTARP